MKNRIIIVFFLMLQITFAQISVPSIDANLKENANSIILSNSTIVAIDKIDKVTYTSNKIIYVLNETGFNQQDFSESYDSSRKIKTLTVKVYNTFGFKIEEIKKSDFIDRSVVDNVSIFTDDRVLDLNYRPKSYPIIIEYISEIESKNSAFLFNWSLYNNLHESTLNSEFKIINNSGLLLNTLERNFENFEISKTILKNEIVLKSSNLKALKSETLAKYDKELPRMYFSLEKVNLENYQFKTSDWSSFGRDYYNNFLKNNSTISSTTKTKIDKIISDSDSKIDKVKKIYQYVQDNTRYVSVQIGVGGWNPMLVSDVEKYGYGDCKALSNYTRAILKEYGIESYYTIIYGGQKKDINEDIVSFQGNHVILSIPQDNKYIHLECTSQTNPYAFLGDFTSNRKALIIKPDGGEIISTTDYADIDNTQNTFAKIKLEKGGIVEGSVSFISKNLQYKNKNQLITQNDENRKKFYKDYFGFLNDLQLSNIELENKKTEYTFVEKFNFSAKNYYNQIGNSIILPLNVFNKFVAIPAKHRNRKFDFEIETGYVDVDEIHFILPDNLKPVVIPNAIIVKEKFGEYQVLTTFENNTIIYKRTLQINKGIFNKDDYNSYREFKEKINQYDQIKIELN